MQAKTCAQVDVEPAKKTLSKFCVDAAMGKPFPIDHINIIFEVDCPGYPAPFSAINSGKVSFMRLVTVFLFGVLLAGVTGCQSWQQTVQAVDGETGQPIGDVKITWIAAHRRFMDYTRSLKEYQTSADGKALLKHSRNNHPFNVVIFEHPRYQDAAVGISEGPGGLEFRLNTPAPISNLAWLRTPSQEARTNAANVVPIITKDCEGIAVLPVVMFRR